MSFEQILIVELIGMIKWIAIGLLLITYASYHINKIARKKSVDTVRIVNLAIKMSSDSAREGVDYLIKELEEKKPRE